MPVEQQLGGVVHANPVLPPAASSSSTLSSSTSGPNESSGSIAAHKTTIPLLPLSPPLLLPLPPLAISASAHTTCTHCTTMPSQFVACYFHPPSAPSATANCAKKHPQCTIAPSIATFAFAAAFPAATCTKVCCFHFLCCSPPAAPYDVSATSTAFHTFQLLLLLSHPLLPLLA